MSEEAEVEFYLKNWTGFLFDFFQMDNRDLVIKISPHGCATGVWYEAQWTTSNGEKRCESSMREGLLKERLIQAFLADFREAMAGE